jgi:hypothetical protein
LEKEQKKDLSCRDVLKVESTPYIVLAKFPGVNRLWRWQRGDGRNSSVKTKGCQKCFKKGLLFPSGMRYSFL